MDKGLQMHVEGLMKPKTTNQRLNIIISAVLLALFSKQWQIERQNGWPEGPAIQLLETIDTLVCAGGAGESDSSLAIKVLQMTMNKIHPANSRLKSCSAADLDWLRELNQAPPDFIEQVLATIWVWLHPMDEELTPQEARAAMLQQNQRHLSVIYRRMRSGLVPGAVKRGRQWLILKSSLVALGYLEPDAMARRLGTQETIRQKPNKKQSGRPPGKRNKT